MTSSPSWAERFRELVHTIRNFRVEEDKTHLYLQFIATEIAAAEAKVWKEVKAIVPEEDREIDGSNPTWRSAWNACRERMLRKLKERTKTKL